jgi:hypothetical protein
MVLKQRDLIQRFTRDDHKRYSVTRALPMVFAADAGITVPNTRVEDNAGGDIWPCLTPVFFDDSVGFWKVWTNGKSIEGFLLGATGLSTELFADNRTGRLQLFTGNEVQGLVLLRGTVHAADVFLPPVETQPNLDLALQSGLREKGIDVDMLNNVH